MLRRSFLIAPFLALALLLVSTARRSVFADPPSLLTMPGDTDATNDTTAPEVETAIEP